MRAFKVSGVSCAAEDFELKHLLIYWAGRIRTLRTAGLWVLFV